MCCHELPRHRSCREQSTLETDAVDILCVCDVFLQVLDASFDDLFPLAQKRVPPAFSMFSSVILSPLFSILPLCLSVRPVSFTHGMIREYYDLNIAEQMCRYVCFDCSYWSAAGVSGCLLALVTGIQVLYSLCGVPRTR